MKKKAGFIDLLIIFFPNEENNKTSQRNDEFYSAPLLSTLVTPVLVQLFVWILSNSCNKSTEIFLLGALKGRVKYVYIHMHTHLCWMPYTLENICYVMFVI